MKKLVVILLLVPFISLNSASGQRKSANSAKRPLRIITKPLPKPKTETENWKIFVSPVLKFSVNLPKEPKISETEIEEDSIKAKSTIHQTYVNQIYYLVEVREYPKGFLPDRNDLSLNYGVWMRDYALEGVKVHNERVFDFGGNLAVEFIYQQTNNDLLLHRAYVIEQKLIQQIIQLEIKKPDDLEQTIEKNKDKINKFLDSFVLIESPAKDSMVG